MLINIGSHCVHIVIIIDFYISVAVLNEMIDVIEKKSSNLEEKNLQVCDSFLFSSFFYFEGLMSVELSVTLS